MRVLVLVLVSVWLGGCAGTGDGWGTGLKEAGQRMWSQPVRPLQPADLGGGVPETGGEWKVAGWEVKAERAWVERSGGVVVRLCAEGAMRATGHGMTLDGEWISVERGGYPVVAEIRRMRSGDALYQSVEPAVRFELVGENRFRFFGKVRRRSMLGL